MEKLKKFDYQDSQITSKSIWSPYTWEDKTDWYDEIYDQQDYKRFLNEEAVMLPLVTVADVQHLQEELVDVYEGKKLYFQAGDCVELFEDMNEISLKDKFDFLNTISDYMQILSNKPSVTLGRMGGQFAKPRSSLTEEVKGVTMYSFMGQIFNDYAPNIWARQPQLQRILWAYKASQMVHEHLIDYTQEKHANRTLFTSHEGLHLPYESSLTQQCQDSNGYYNLSSHFQWVGMRSLFEDSAHIEFYRGLENPIGIKVGPSATPALLDQVCTVLNPRNVPGKLTLILRLGDKVSEVLPSLIKQVKSKGHKVIWVSDPMHANTVKNAQGVKTRSLDKIKAEVKQVSQILRENNCYFAGLHLEASPDNIYECADSCDLMAKVDLGKAYQTQCDPRLNFEQTINVVSCFINHSKKGS